MKKKVRDCAVVVGKYTDREGKERSQWENIGAIWEDISSQGEKYQFMTFKRTFNPAAIPPAREGSDSFYVSLFIPRGNNSENGFQSGTRQNQSNGNAQGFNAGNIEDCPF